MRPALRDRLVMPVLLPLGILAVIAAALFGFSRIMLSLTPTAATATAIVVATGVGVPSSEACPVRSENLYACTVADPV